jgi:hypothetical protein
MMGLLTHHVTTGRGGSPLLALSGGAWSVVTDVSIVQLAGKIAL